MRSSLGICRFLVRVAGELSGSDMFFPFCRFGLVSPLCGVAVVFHGLVSFLPVELFLLPPISLCLCVTKVVDSPVVGGCMVICDFFC